VALVETPKTLRRPGVIPLFEQGLRLRVVLGEELVEVGDVVDQTAEKENQG